MKLLGWMHRKFRQNGGEPYRDLNTGYPCNCLSGRPSLEESQQQHHHGYQKQSRVPLRRIHDQFLFYEEEAGVHTDDPNEEAPPALEELFQGLLAIGTLGSLGQVQGEDPAEAGDATPTFGLPGMPVLSVDAIAEKEEGYEATEDDLMIINAEIEKVLLAPEAEKSDRISSARASQVSAKQLVATGCPLQEYLFGSLVEMTETVAMAGEMESQEKKEHQRTSLGELFKRSRMVEEGGKKEKPTAGMHLMVKKILKCRGAGGSSRSATCDVSTSDCSGSPGQAVNCETKFHRIIQMFYRKVHPESSVATKKATKVGKCRSKGTDGGRSNSRGIGKAAMLAGINGLMRKERELRMKKNATVLSDAEVGGSSCGDSSGNKEHWIKTDAEYLVLEL